MITYALWKMAIFLNLKYKFLLVLPIVNLIYACYVLGEVLVLIKEWRYSYSAEVSGVSISILLLGVSFLPVSLYLSRVFLLYGTVLLVGTIYYTYMSLKTCFKIYLWILPAPFALLAMSYKLDSRVREALCD